MSDPVLEEVMVVVDYYKRPFDEVLSMPVDVFALHLAWMKILKDRRNRG